MLSALLMLSGAAIQPPPIIPKPTTLKMEQGSWPLDLRGTKIVAKGEAAKAAELLTLGIKKDLKVTPGQGQLSSQISLGVDSSLLGDLGEEGYDLSIKNRRISLRAGNPRGLFFAVQTLKQIIGTSQAEGQIVHNMTIRDKPRFAWRGMMLDCSRHFWTVAEIKDFINLLAHYKFNTFHWHLIDDGGWRMEVKKYPQLTEIGAWRTDLGDEVWNYNKMEFPGKGSGKKLYGGYYTQKEIKEIVAFAQDRAVTIIPEIEMPGHCLPAMVAVPESSCDIVKPDNRPYRANAYCAGKEFTFEFLEDVLDETMELFPSKIIHIGGDEVDKVYWSECPKCKQRMSDEKLKDTHELQSYFVHRIEKYLNSKGRTLMGWDEILEGGLAPNAMVMSWRGEAGGITAAKSGHDVVMTPTSHCYFDYSYEAIPTNLVYAYEPIPAVLKGEERNRVLGAQGNIWTEWMANYEKVQVMALPRMLAMSEVLWSPKEGRSFSDFNTRLAGSYSKFISENRPFHIDLLQAEVPFVVFKKPVKVSLSTPPIRGLEVRWTRDGSVPTVKSPLLKGDILVNKPGVYQAMAFLQGKPFNKPAVVVARKTSKVEPKLLTYKLVEKAFERLPNFTQQAGKTGVARALSIDLWKQIPSFAVEFAGTLKISKAGTYEFTLTSDDGSGLWIDGVQVVNHDGPHAATPKTSKAILEPGIYPFAIRYFEQGGAEAFKAEVKGPGVSGLLDQLVVRP